MLIFAKAKISFKSTYNVNDFCRVTGIILKATGLN